MKGFVFRSLFFMLHSSCSMAKKNLFFWNFWSTDTTSKSFFYFRLTVLCGRLNWFLDVRKMTPSHWLILGFLDYSGRQKGSVKRFLIQKRNVSTVCVYTNTFQWWDWPFFHGQTHGVYHPNWPVRVANSWVPVWIGSDAGWIQFFEVPVRECSWDCWKAIFCTFAAHGSHIAEG